MPGIVSRHLTHPSTNTQQQNQRQMTKNCFHKDKSRKLG
jgi:hypothetical protein